MLYGVKNSIDSNFLSSGEKMRCGFGDDFQSLFDSIRELTKVNQEGLSAGKIFCLREGIENRLKKRSFRS